MSLFAVVPGRLGESSAEALGWPALRAHVAGRCSSVLGREWTLGLEPSSDLVWIAGQQVRTEEVRGLIRGGVVFSFAGLFDPTELLEKARVEGAALEGVEILQMLLLAERAAEWREVVGSVADPEHGRGRDAGFSTTALRASGRNDKNLGGEEQKQVPFGDDNGGGGGGVDGSGSGGGEEQKQVPFGDGGVGVGGGIGWLSRGVVARDWAPLLRQLRGKVEPDGTLSDEASPELKRIRRAMERQHRVIEETLRKTLRAVSAEGAVQDEVITVRNERFVIPVKTEFRRRVPGVVHGGSSSGQTVFVEPLEVMEGNNELIRLLDEEQGEIHRILRMLTGVVGEWAGVLLDAAGVLAEVESHWARAKFADELGCVRPVFLPQPASWPGTPGFVSQRAGWRGVGGGVETRPSGARTGHPGSVAGGDAGFSTALRSGRNDNEFVPDAVNHVGQGREEMQVSPLRAERSGRNDNLLAGGEQQQQGQGQKQVPFGDDKQGQGREEMQVSPLRAERSGRNDNLLAGGEQQQQGRGQEQVPFGDDKAEGGGLRLELREARHPLLELRMRRDARSRAGVTAGTGFDAGTGAPAGTGFSAGTGAAAGTGVLSGPVPLTLRLEDEARELIVSGPNTGGKTVTLKTVGLLALMAQAGMPVPAEGAVLPVFRSVFADIGDAQSIEANLSSFSAHMVNVNRIAREAGPDSLVLLDELGSATDPEEGAALAVAIAGRFLEMRSWTCITTHLTSMKVYAASRPGVLNAAVGFDPETLMPTYRLRMGVPGASAGINIAERLGLDPGIVREARAQMQTQTADIAALLDSLHDQLAAVTGERTAIAAKERELVRERLRLETEGRAEQKERTRQLEKKLDALLDDFDAQVREIVKGIGDKSLAQRIQRDALTRKARAKREVSEEFKATVVAHTTGADKNDPNGGPGLKGVRDRVAALAAQVAALKPGDSVMVKSLGRQARVERVFEAKGPGGGREFEVSAGVMKMRVGAGDVAEVLSAKAAAAATPLQEARRRGGVTVQTASEPDDVAMEINVIGKTADEAEDEVSRFVDRAFLAGRRELRIVHGTGMGVLRRTLREFLRRHPNVAEVTEPPYYAGGQGATEVKLKQ